MSDAAPSNPKLVSSFEQATDRGWRYQVQIQGLAGTSEHTITLSWVDHDFWCGGRDAPSQTLTRVVEAALSAGISLPDKIDCATIRRLLPSLDRSIGPNTRIGQSAA